MPFRWPLRTSVLLLLLLAGCQTPVVDRTGPLDIRRVTVTAAPAIASQSDLRGSVRNAVSERVVDLHDGQPAELAIAIDDLTYKNAVMSMLGGSANSLSTTVTITDASGTPLATFPYKVVLDVAVNGLIGAAIAIGQDKTEVDRRLVEAYANELQRRIFGAPGHVPKTKG